MLLVFKCNKNLNWKEFYIFNKNTATISLNYHFYQYKMEVYLNTLAITKICIIVRIYLSCHEEKCKIGSFYFGVPHMTHLHMVDYPNIACFFQLLLQTSGYISNSTPFITIERSCLKNGFPDISYQLIIICFQSW